MNPRCAQNPTLRLKACNVLFRQSSASEGEAVFGEVGVGGLDAEGAEHGDDLAAMDVEWLTA